MGFRDATKNAKKAFGKFNRQGKGKGFKAAQKNAMPFGKGKQMPDKEMGDKMSPFARAKKRNMKKGSC